MELVSGVIPARLIGEPESAVISDVFPNRNPK
jgi:hypothetical protein